MYVLLLGKILKNLRKSLNEFLIGVNCKFTVLKHGIFLNSAISFNASDIYKKMNSNIKFSHYDASLVIGFASFKVNRICDVLCIR